MKTLLEDIARGENYTLDFKLIPNRERGKNLNAAVRTNVIEMLAENRMSL